MCQVGLDEFCHESRGDYIMSLPRGLMNDHCYIYIYIYIREIREVNKYILFFIKK